jgi:hypothetical protein
MNVDFDHGCGLVSPEDQEIAHQCCHALQCQLTPGTLPKPQMSPLSN